MFSDNGAISIRQLQCLMILNMFISMLILMPRIVTGLYGNMAWVTVIIATVGVWIYSKFIIKVSNKLGHENFTNAICKAVSKPVGIIILIGFLARFIIGAGLQLRIFGEVVVRNILNNTPVWLIGFFLILVCLYTATGGYEVRARIGEILVALVIIFSVLIFLFSLEQMDFSQVFLNKGYSGKGLWSGVLYAIFAFQGLEVLLFAKPYVTRKGKISKEVGKAVIFIGALCTVGVLLAIAYFGTSGVADRWIAVIDMMNTVDFRFSFGQKQDIIVMGIWIASMFGVINSSLFFGNMIASRVCKKQLITAVAVAVAIFVVSLLPQDITKLYYYYDLYIKISGAVFLIGIPVLIYVISLIKGGAKSEN